MGYIIPKDQDTAYEIGAAELNLIENQQLEETERILKAETRGCTMLCIGYILPCNLFPKPEGEADEQ